jgi:methyl-accepting chemotaxis protein
MSLLSDVQSEIQTCEKYFFEYLYYNSATRRGIADRGFQKARKEVMASISEMESIVTSENQEQLQEITILVDSTFSVMDEVMEQDGSGKSEIKIRDATVEIQEALDTINTKVNTLCEDSLTAMEASSDAGEEVFAHINTVLVALTALIVAIMLVALGIVYYYVDRPFRVHYTSDTIKENLVLVNTNSTSISEMAQELSASMERVANTTTSLVSDAKGMLESIMNVSNGTEEGQSLVEGIRTSASDIRITTQQNRTAIAAELKEKRELLEKAIGEARKIDEISLMTDDILDVASKTTLLALNASIEATHAGESGKDFAVIAEEIRCLADASRRTANNIRQISRSATGAVDSLKDNANGLLEYVNTRINDDYSGIESAVTAYYNNAEKMEGIVSLFYDNIDSLKSATEQITSSLGTVAESITRCSRGVSESSESISTLVNNISEIGLDAQDNFIKFESLNQEMRKL